MRKLAKKLLTEAEIVTLFQRPLACRLSHEPVKFPLIRVKLSRTEGKQLPTSSSQELTGLLRRWSGGDERALERIIELAYPELRRLAQRCLGRERPLHTLEATAVVHEAYLRLVDVPQVPWHDRVHFFALDSEIVRLHDALEDLAKFDARKAQVVEMRYFGGLTSTEIASVLGVSPQSVNRDWSLAKAWLTREMSRSDAMEV